MSKRKFTYTGPREFWAEDCMVAEEILLSGLEEEEKNVSELTDEEKNDMRGDEMYSDSKERDL